LFIENADDEAIKDVDNAIIVKIKEKTSKFKSNQPVLLLSSPGLGNSPNAWLCLPSQPN